MSQVLLKATLKKGGGALGAQMIIDSTGLTFDVNGDGETTVQSGSHVVTVLVEGPPGAKADFGVNQNGGSLISGSVVVGAGHTNAVGYGPFDTK
jgi:hypothetical protein